MSAPVLLFDGYCNLCNRLVDFVIRHDRARAVRYGSLQSAAASELLEADGTGDADSSTVVLIDADGVWRRSDAVLRVVGRLGVPWRWLTVLRIVPRSVRDWGYDIVARNRGRWFGRRTSCRIPTAAERELFLD